jgi:2-polyprenyl-6-methoxyphenol hydroxylase-like FAD-dependent oxidoreductase
MREQTEVLVVGAGPVGLWTALLMAEAGLEVSIIDRESRTTTRSYACALHPRTLQALARLDLAEGLVTQGRKISTMAFYEGPDRRAELNLSAVGGEFPFLLIVPQSTLEDALEERLRQAGVHVRWNHRFDALAAAETEVAADIEELGGTSTGYIVPHWETIVKRRVRLAAQVLIGADGHNSLVRQRLGLDYRRAGDKQYFAAYEFESDHPCADEVRVVFANGTANVLWPLPGNKCRWTFQVLHSELNGFPEKERRLSRVSSKTVDDRLRAYVEAMAKKRAPWFSAGVKEVTWCTEVVFEPKVVESFGRQRCWLAGDAAHQTGPAGVQSMNAGFLEGLTLSAMAKQLLQEKGSVEAFGTYDQQQQEAWGRLLNLGGGLKSRSTASAWVSDHAAQLLPCLPALDTELPRLASQLQLDPG